MMVSEAEHQALENAIFAALEGLSVSVSQIGHYLDREGVQNIMDRLRARGFKVVRAD